MPRHGHAIVMVSKWRCWQGLALVLGGVMKLQSCREAQGWTWSNQIFSMGNIPHPACKVFEVMPARKIFSNFEILFGGLQTNIKWSILVVVVVKKELRCKITFCI
jgi:hypothetical protein